jgi:isochorismate hydrolase
LYLAGYGTPWVPNDMRFESEWMQLEDMMLCDVIQDKKYKSHMFSLSYVKDRSKDKQIHKNKHDHIKLRSRACL